jgi:hypothetical protein
LEEDGLVRNVFRVLSTVDFEEVMHALEHAATIEEAYGETRRAKQFQTDAGVVRESLIHAPFTQRFVSRYRRNRLIDVPHF